MTQSISSLTVTIDLSDYPEESFVTDTVASLLIIYHQV